MDDDSVGIAIEELQRLLDCKDDELPNSEKLQIAQAAFAAVIAITEEVIDETKNETGRAYLLDHMKTMLDSNHGFLCNNLNFEKLIEQTLEHEKLQEDLK